MIAHLHGRCAGHGPALAVALLAGMALWGNALAGESRVLDGAGGVGAAQARGAPKSGEAEAAIRRIAPPEEDGKYLSYSADVGIFRPNHGDSAKHRRASARVGVRIGQRSPGDVCVSR